MIAIYTLFVTLLITGLALSKPLLHLFKTQSEIKTYTHNNFFVKYRKINLSQNLKAKGSIFIYPPTGGENIIDRLYARQLANLGFEVFILQDWTGYEISGYEYSLHNVFYSSAQKALEQVAKQEATTENWGVLGTSVGALHASITLTVNPKVKTGFLIVGGLPIPEIIVQSSQQAMKDLKTKRYSMYHLKNDEEYIKELSAAFKYEPTKIQLEPTKAITTAMILSTNDDLVPYKNQVMAEKFFKPQTVLKSSLNHRNTIAWFGLFEPTTVTHFFKTKL